MDVLNLQGDDVLIWDLAGPTTSGGFKDFFDLIILGEMIQFDCCPGIVLPVEFFHVDENMLLQIARECIPI